MKKTIGILAAALSAALLLAGCGSEVGGTDAPSSTASGATSGGASESLTGTLKFAGSSSMEGVVNALGEAFKAKNPGISVTVDQQGSGSAVPALNDGTAGIGNLSRKVKAEENADGKYEVINIAIDGIAVVVNPENKVADLTLEQIAQVFKGEITNWKELGGDSDPIYVVGREEGSGTRDGFEEVVGVKGKCKYGTLLKETGDVVSRVASEKAAIGYISFASVSDKVTAVKVGGVPVSDEAIADGSYKLQRPFVQVYRKGTTDALTLAYLEFLKSDEGQSIVKEEKLIPVKFWEQ